MRWTRLTQRLGIDPAPPPPLAVSDDEAFALHARRLTRRNTQLAALFIAAASLGTLALERVLYAGVSDSRGLLLGLRLGLTVLGAAAFLALLWGPGARRPLAPSLAMITAGSALLGHVAGLLGGLGASWFHFTHVVLLSLLVTAVELPWRALCCFVMPASLLAGFALSRVSSTAPVSLVPNVAFLFFVATVSSVLGHIIHSLHRRSFCASRAQQRLSLELEALNGTLEQRVGDQTRELRMLAAHLESAREDERTRLARELHDELGQELTALRYALAFLRKRYDRDPAGVRGNLEELDALVARTAATARQILTDLRPRVLDDLGLDAAVEWLARQTEERTGVACRLSISTRPVVLDADVSIAAFRIFQESLTNVVRHAQATRVDMEIAAFDDHVRLTVRDDGIGLPAPAPGAAHRSGMGLIGIRERVQALGGELRLESAPAGGTTVDVRLPLVARRGAEIEA